MACVNKQELEARRCARHSKPWPQKLLPPELERQGSDPLVPGWLRILTQDGQAKSPDRSGAKVKIHSPCVASPSDLAAFSGDPQGSLGAETGAAYLEACILRYVPYCTGCHQ